MRGVKDTKGADRKKGRDGGYTDREGLSDRLSYRNKQIKEERQTGDRQKQRQRMTDGDGRKEGECGGKQPGGSIISD